ncbi:hypothetical protein CEN49_23445, partial [Fischerella thermalis CCMEE 5273]
PLFSYKNNRGYILQFNKKSAVVFLFNCEIDTQVNLFVQVVFTHVVTYTTIRTPLGNGNF